MLLAVSAAMAVPGPSGAQACSPGTCAAPSLTGGAAADRQLAIATVQAVQERVGTAIWGGNPVPGTASTLGLRIGTTPRVSLSGQLRLVPAELPPLLDMTAVRGRRTLLPGLSAQASLGMLPGWSPVSTVGGVLSVDLIGRLSVVPLSSGAGFETGAAVGGSAGVRLGLLRESFTMPGLSLTGSYGRSSTIRLGDRDLEDADGFVRGAVTDLNGTLAASRRFGGLRLAVGVTADRYSTRAQVGYRPREPVELVEPAGERVRVVTHRRSLFANAAWTFLIFHASTELGWQRVPAPTGLPEGVRVDPTGWWVGTAFRLSI